MKPEMANSEGSPNAFAYVQTWHQTRDQTGWWHSFELPGGRMIEGVSTLSAQKMRIGQFPIPDDLSGKRVLDVGTWDGWFAMEMERRGAEVVAIDNWENPRFYEIHELLGSRVDYRQLSVYDLNPDQLGRFDIVLFMGVLYHLKHPLLALERVCSVAKDLVAVESFVLKDRHRPGLGVENHPLMEFYENDEFGGQFDNWVAPTVPCLLGFCRTAGFARAELNNVHDYGAAVTCYRTWPGGSASVAPLDQNLKLVGAFNTDNGGLNFRSSSSDDYVGCHVAAEGVGLSSNSIQPEVSGYGSQPVFVGLVEGYWRVHFKLPPGLSSGWHQVRLRTPEAVSNSVEIAVDVPLVAESLEIRAVYDAVNWQPFRISLENGFVSIWVYGLPRNADRNNVKVSLAGKRQFTTFAGAPTPDGATQVNARLRGDTPKGKQRLDIRFGAINALPVTVEITA
jgi:tRNA (mo5U34)-methyltransferase